MAWQNSLWKPFHNRSMIGAAPGTISADVDSHVASKLHVINYSKDDFQSKAFTSLEEMPETSGVTWLNICGLADVDLIRAVGDRYQLHPLALEDVVNTHQRCKIEDYGDHLFMVSRMVYPDGEHMTSEQISIFLVGNTVITFQEFEGDCLDVVRKRLKAGRGRARKMKADYLAYAILDAIVDNFFPVIESIGNQLNEIEERLELAPEAKIVREIRQSRADLLFLRKIAWPQRDAISSLLRDDSELMTDETRLFMRDCHDHAVQAMEVTEMYRELCSDLRDTHLAEVSQRTNEVMKTLTIVSTIFIPLSFIAGVYGMNFDRMPELKFRFGYYYALGLMAICASGLLIWFIRRGWLFGKR